MVNANFEKTLIRRGCGSVTYKVANYEGMTEEDIMFMCDSHPYGCDMHGDIITVYID